MTYNKINKEITAFEYFPMPEYNFTGTETCSYYDYESESPIDSEILVFGD